MSERPIASTIGASLFGAFVLLALLEVAIGWALNSEPGSGPASFEAARKSWYTNHERRIVQYLPECAEHDPQLGYRLKPGTCVFANREFETTLEINSLGLRDSEAALEAPGIVVIGDSFAMGWGVEQSETLAAQLERITGEKTLNMAVSSYATARELIALQRADLSNAHSLVIQYCENDYTENRQAQQGRGQFNVMNAEAYQEVRDDHLRSIRYFPGKHVAIFFPLWFQLAFAERNETRDCLLDAEAFWHVLHLAGRPPLPAGRRLRLIVFEGILDARQTGCFTDRLAFGARHGGLPPWVESLRVIDSASLLDESDYYPLDGHLRASGHEKLARAVSAELPAEVGRAE